jgi:hypothetical protein
MFKWYREAAECYAYLFDVVATEKDASVFKRESSNKCSEWFERGWTLQELLAPRAMRFFDKNWTVIGTRKELAPEIARITGIEVRFLDGSAAFRTANIATKLSWMAHRKTSKEEDMAYCLLGIFDVDLVPTYGEGRRVFLKLQQRLLQSYKDESIFAWKLPPGSRLPKHDHDWDQDEWGLLAPWFDCFQDSGDIVTTGEAVYRPPGAITPIAGGVKFPAPITELRRNPGGMTLIFTVLVLTVGLGGIIVGAFWNRQHRRRQEWSLTLNCWKKNDTGKLTPIQIFLCRDSHNRDEFWRRTRCGDTRLARKLPDLWYGVHDITVVQPTGVYWPVETIGPASAEAIYDVGCAKKPKKSIGGDAIVQ